MPSYSHIPVMPGEVLRLLDPQPGDIALDGTTGLGGHSRLMADAVGANGAKGRLLCFDRDPEAIMQARENLAEVEVPITFIRATYDRMGEEVRRLGIERVQRILLDLGVSSLQLDRPERGFSFRNDGPLDMRMDQEGGGPTAMEIVNTWPEERLKDLFERLGEERFSGRLAKRIAEARLQKPIETTAVLSARAEEAVPFRGKIHPATRMFQALRMEVNDELGALSRGLMQAGRLLSPGGRLAVITFHSLEDRLVKRTFLRWRELGAARLVTSHAVSATRGEALENRRSRSAKLRVVEKT